MDKKYTLPIIISVGLLFLCICCCSVIFIVVGIFSGETSSETKTDTEAVVQEENLKEVDTTDYTFFYPKEFKSIVPSETAVEYHYGNDNGASINVAEYRYLDGRELDREECRVILSAFEDSSLKDQLNADVVGSFVFEDDYDVTTCYYHYQAKIAGETLNVEYKVFQGDSLYSNYAVTLTYSSGDSSTDDLKESQKRFELK